MTNENRIFCFVIMETIMERTEIVGSQWSSPTTLYGGCARSTLYSGLSLSSFVDLDNQRHVTSSDFGQYSGDGGGIFGNLPQPTSRDTWDFADPIPIIEGKRFTCWAIDTFSCKNDSCSGLGFYNIQNINNIK